MVVSNDRFWAKVLFREYIRHYRKMTDEQIVNDVRQSMDDLEELVEDSPTFGSKMVKWSMQRQQEPPAIASRENGRQGGRPRKNSKCTATGNDQVPADAATREGAEVTNSAGNGVIPEPANVCKNAEEGGTRKDPLNMTTVRKNGALESGTSSANLQGSARPKKTGAGASIAPLLISPLENRAPSPTIANRSDKKQPVNIGAAAPVPPLGSLDCHNREPLAPSPGASHISGDVMSLAYSGEFGNVRLTQEQYAQLGIKFGNQQKLNRAIDSLSCQIENGEKNPANHYAELVKWANYRDDMEEKEELKASTAQHYETVSEHNARIVRESDAWIHEYCQQQQKKRKAANG